ncbi:MAG: alpha/beta hydrolase [Ruminococcus sp.]|nr:alpha/beta hydrolase [Ruminococcus sp.]
MKHRILCAALAIVMIFSLCACAASGDSASGHTLYVRDEYSHDSIDATFLSTDGGESKTVTMKSLGEDDGATLFSCEGDTEKFDRVVFTYNDESTIELAFNDYVSGWQIDSHHFTPYTYEGVNDTPTFTRVKFDYESRKKDICIWTPGDYDANSEEKYSVIYMTDAQNLFDPSATSTGSWGVAEAVRGMMKESSNKCIIVGIENPPGYRDEELTPNLGKSTQDSYDDGKGIEFCDFVYNTVVPYVEENYNVYADPQHNAVCGSSSGGIECFYIGMEHPEKFGTIGALSPAFGLFDNATWDKYLAEKDFSAGYPFVYIYNGNSDKDQLEQYLLEGAEDMPDNLKKIGYPEDKIVVKVYDKGMHNEMHWRAVFPEFLKYMFPQTETPAE